MNVYFVDSLPATANGVYIDYFNKDYGSQGWRHIDIERIISLRQEDFFLAIEKWHSDICIKGSLRFKWWWLLPASRLILWHPPIWKPLVFALAVAEQLESLNEEELYLVGCPVEMGEYLREFYPKLWIHDGRKIQHAFMHRLHCLLISLKYICELLNYILTRRKKNLAVTHLSPVVIWTYGLNLGADQINRKDHFFGDMFDSHLFHHPVHWVYYDSPRNASEKCFSMYPSDSRSLIYDWIGLSEWWSLVKFCFFEEIFRRTTVSVPEFALNGYISKAFARYFASTMIDGSIPHAEFAIFLCMKKILKELSPKALVYPYEEKCLERALLKAARESMSAPVTIGFAHALYNKGLMYLRRRSEEGANPPSPDKLLVTGPALKKWLVDWASWDENRLFVAGSPRYQTMTDVDSKEAFGGRPLHILILIGQGYEATVLASQFQNNPKVFDGCEVIIRPYPHSWQTEQDKAYAIIKKICKHIQVIGGSLAAQLSWCDIAVYCSTTAGLEAMLRGKLTVFLDMNHIFSLNPIDEKIQDEMLWRFKDLSELQSLLDRVNHMTKDSYAKIVASQSNLAGQIFQKVNHVCLNAFFQDNLKNK